MNDKANEPSSPSRGQEDCPLDSSSSRKETAEKPLRGQIGGIGAQLGANQFSVSEAIGGPWGALEATLPTLLVVAVYPFVHSLRLPVILALAATFIFASIRLLRHQSLRQVFAGLAGTLISVFWAWRSGQVENFFAFGFWINGVYAAVLVVTILCRRPAIGWLVAGVSGKLSSWRKHSSRRFYSLARTCTWMWVALFTVRLAVELPLYYANLLVPLGAARLILGLPAFALVGYFNWVLLREETANLRGRD